MGDFEITYYDKCFSAQEELKELQARESRENLMILFKDKEIQKLKSQLQDIEQKISENKKAYSQTNTKTALLHPFVTEEFEFLRKDLQETHQKINSLTMDNYFKKNSEANPPSALNQLVKFMEKTSGEVISETAESKLDHTTQQITRKKTIIDDLEQKLKENRSYIKHLEVEISETEDIIIALHAKISQIDLQCEEIKKENTKLSAKNETRGKRH
ncbi:hypothetical protein SteCoe_36087 [Stentor coeruleus]|uniref:Uncharacterized protein n=1 Tax=Stentor coeruleus TaxID=5963 RepID=A0A1R2AR39_9CILI|nr:hypothetical protein SteCoe_36087 [Stentor coeruleus]